MRWDPEPLPVLTLYRPVGQAELDLIAAAGWRAFPPRLPYQPIFYPVLTETYATEIARDWNTKDAASGYVGYVTTFEIDQAFAARYSVQRVGAASHQELWVPAEDLAEFNRHLRGPIRVIATYHGNSMGAGFPAMLRFDVFGRTMGVERQGEVWALFSLDNPSGRRLLSTTLIPGTITEAELATQLADLFHESARPDRPTVRRL